VRTWLTALAFLFLVLGANATPAESPAERCAPGATRERQELRFAHRCVSTTNAHAQEAFDEGLTLLYAFNPEEARRAFERATHADPNLAPAWWGVALTYVPNINQSYDAAAAPRGRDAIAKARALGVQATPVERALIDAAARRFAFVGPHDADRTARAYRDAMATVADAYTSDDDVAVLAAEAEMDVHPWAYFNTDGTPTPGTLGLIARLRTVLARTPDHLGANHFAIHAFEESAHPEDGRAAADRLAGGHFAPAAEHLTHMPAHAYMRVGAYHEAGEANARAVRAYLQYLAGDPAGHADYFGHDCVFGVDAFMMSGEAARARALAEACKKDGARLATVVDLRFHDWSALARDDAASDFAGGMLLAHEGRLALATEHLRTLRASGDSLSALEAGVLEARIARAGGESSTEIAALERAVKIQDGFGYAEPPTFWYPVRESLGGAFARAGRYAEAERVFRTELDRDRDNPRALFGLAQTLTRAGKTDDAREPHARFERAWRQADAELDLNTL